ncbi:MAG: hypothetical protein WC697_01675 [Patescibacteria group bacterium]|jgi:hypothetical protein
MARRKIYRAVIVISHTGKEILVNGKIGIKGFGYIKVNHIKKRVYNEILQGLKSEMEKNKINTVTVPNKKDPNPIIGVKNDYILIVDMKKGETKRQRLQKSIEIGYTDKEKVNKIFEIVLNLLLKQKEIMVIKK